jgi:hypothetical protein
MDEPLGVAFDEGGKRIAKARLGERHQFVIAAVGQGAARWAHQARKEHHSPKNTPPVRVVETKRKSGVAQRRSAEALESAGLLSGSINAP